jgi:ribosome-binding ATPase YchF (GTP1/OBG family)
VFEIIIGLIGKPSSGKSSFFKAATMIDVKISPVPFTTIQPNVGIGYVTIDCVEKEFGVTCNPRHGHCKNGKRFVPVKLVDVGGLIPGSHEGRGIGNKFLDEIRQASVLVQVIDASGMTDAEGNPTQGFNPEEEIKFLEEEIDLWFASVLEKALGKIKTKDRDEILKLLQEQLSGLEITKAQVEKVLDNTPLSDVKKFASELRKASKPITIAANKIDLKEAQENFEQLQKHANIIPTSAESEIILKKAAEKNLIEYDVGNGFTILDPYKLSNAQLAVLDMVQKNVVGKYGSTGVQECLNKAVFQLLGYIVVYPVASASKLNDKDGNILPDVFLVPSGTMVRELAFKVHTSLGEKFITGIDARTKKRLAADAQLKNGDVVEIVSGK